MLQTYKAVEFYLSALAIEDGDILYYISLSLGPLHYECLDLELL